MPVRPIRVVVVDDHELFRRGITQVLSDEADIEVVGEAEDGPAAVATAEALAPDVVLLDLRMPGMGGIEVARRLVATLPGVRILVLTVSDEPDDLFEAVKAGVAGYLLKEVPIHEVAEAVRSVARGHAVVSPSMAGTLAAEFASLARRADAEQHRLQGTRLTAREVDVLKLVAQGRTNRDIGRLLFISENTVKRHVRSILEKLDVHSRMEAVLYAVREEIVDVGDAGAAPDPPHEQA